MAIIGTILLGLAVVIATIFGRAAFLGEGRGTFPLALDELFYWGQWLAFWIAVPSLLLLGTVWIRNPEQRLTWKGCALAGAVAFMIYFFCCSMPEMSNRDRWPHGALGLNIYLRTKYTRWQSEAAERRLRKAFAGDWGNSHGAMVRIGEDRFELRPAGGKTGGKGVQIRTSEQGELRFGNAGLKDIGYHFYRANLLRSPLFRNLADRDYPVLTHVDGGGQTAFVLLEPRQLFAVLPDGTSMIFFR